MASFERSSEYMIFRHEKIRLVDVLSLLVRRRRIGDYEFVECSEGSAKQLQEANAIPNWRTVISLIALWFLKMIGGALSLLGVIVQFSLNFYSLNGGVLGLIRRILTGSVVIPKSDSKDFKSIIGFIDGRLDIYKASSLLGYFPIINDMGKSIRFKPLDICMMAAKVVYENEAYIQNAVTSHWKMHLAGFFNCWNEFQGSADTQVFIFCDQPEDAKTIIVAFRGTEPFNAKDWSTDIDFSWISMGKMGKAHLGFMKALGIQNEHDYVEGWPNELKQEKGKPLAYYSIRETLKSLLLKHKSAKIVVTGHSLGGALAAVFPSILYLHGENDILNRMSVITFGQPRVGDETFANFMESEVGSVYKMNFVRVVYRYDLVPRVPFDSNLFKFEHFGYCLYFNGWYHGEALDEEPNRNYFSPKYLFSKYMNAWGDLIKALFIGIKEGKDFREGGVSLSFRFVGLLFPGLASHSPRDYLNAARLGKIIVAEKEMV